MRLKSMFFLLILLLVCLVLLLAYMVLGGHSFKLFFWIEGLMVLVIVLLFLLYQRIIKPLYTLGNGMDLLNEQDFSSRLGRVGQKETDRIVDVFNRIMDQLKNERLRLREQNHFLDLLIQASPMGVIILNLDRQILSVNPAACKMLRITGEEEVIGNTLSGRNDLPLLEELDRVPLDGSQTIRLSDANVYKCSHSSFMDQGFSHDFYLIEMLTQEVFKAEKKAYEKVIRMISHEVNNTTAGITSTLDTLESTFSGMEDMKDVCDVLQISIDRCYSMSRFITNFADVVRIPEPQCKPTSLNELVTSCKRFMETICMSRDIELRMELADDLPMVEIDRSLFEQVLVNIIKNSAESIGRQGHIYIRTTTHPLCLEVGDDGQGISKETEAKLFSPFFSTKPNGQGIGLIFIREVLQRHQCSFSLKTYADGITRFKIWL